MLDNVGGCFGRAGALDLASALPLEAEPAALVALGGGPRGDREEADDVQQRIVDELVILEGQIKDALESLETEALEQWKTELREVSELHPTLCG